MPPKRAAVLSPLKWLCMSGERPACGRCSHWETAGSVLWHGTGPTWCDTDLSAHSLKEQLNYYTR